MNFAAVVRTMTSARSAEQRVSQYDWKALSQELSSYGCAVMKKLLSPEECREIAAALRRRRSLSKPHSHGATWLWQR